MLHFQVVIEGFKSFKEKTTFEFLPGLNFVGKKTIIICFNYFPKNHVLFWLVPVGHDEAGKNNLLYGNNINCYLITLIFKWIFCIFFHLLNCHFNTLSAIQFALAAGHQFQQGTQTNLVKLLYSSSAGVRAKSAYVEIIIDNQDKSIRVKHAS